MLFGSNNEKPPSLVETAKSMPLLSRPRIILGSRFVTNKFLGVKELEQDNYSNASNKGARFGTYVKFIGDGEKGGDKKSIASGDENKMLEVTPDRYDKKSESTNTLSPQEDKD